MKKDAPRKRATLPKAIADAFKSGDKHGAMNLAIFGREANSLTEIASWIYWLLKLDTNREMQNLAISSGGERHGWNAPRRQSLQERMQRFEKWKTTKEKHLQAQIDIGIARHGEKFLADLEREFARVCKEDATVFLFSPPGITKSETDNPNWFRQILIANLGIKTLTGKDPAPLLKLAKEIKIPVRTLRREVRKMGVERGKPGTTKRRKPDPLI